MLCTTGNADCECGYTVNKTDSSTHQVFTDLLEANFLTSHVIGDNTDWKVQKYYTQPKPKFGRNCTAENVVSNPVLDNSTLDGGGKLGGTPGLQIWVRGGTMENNLVPSGEIRSTRNDMLYGSFRVAARLTPVNGTCSAIFTVSFVPFFVIFMSLRTDSMKYFNDSQEIDIELLSRQYSSNAPVVSSPLNLVLHSMSALEAGYQTPNTSTYGQPRIPVALTDMFHEYRFDWTPGLVSFYLDGSWIWDLEDSNVPSMGSALLLSHWSNGAPGWSQGPPLEDAVMTISYVKAYFNSSDPQRHQDFQTRCSDPTAPGAMCMIPHQEGAPDALGGNGSSGAVSGGRRTYFFSAQSNHTVNQTVFTGKNTASSQVCARSRILPTVIWIAVLYLVFL